ncbi:NAD(+)/NADH kinase [Halalkalicoccus sp. NIPERK01]|uniref:NAD(+)/NADH kinase n=1 Tax=Halalkalicoccus sp. NIPERK01 TaxID=3053469 RepID=UPI00256EE7C8|nr:NAD(+)/NADH kinase [Halalkalicoccus sp. NIPERK01]MDL5362225.1 NAD(+)/NADH kinase [Halalkalicoccus sp. NIPERK01]
MDVGIVAQKDNARAANLADELRETLREEGVAVQVDCATASALSMAGVDPGEMRDCDLVVSIGGDGTFLFTARGVGATPILGVNLGEVGFLNAVSPDSAVSAVREELEYARRTGTVRSRSVPRIEARGEDWTLMPAVNEVVVQGPQRGHGQGCTVEVRVDGSLYTGGHADGVLLSTPTGSTAYNLSEGGPLVHPGVSGIVITEMCATEAMPSLVVGDDHTLTVRVDDADLAYVISDGKEQRAIEPPAQVEIGLAEEPARLAGPPVDFFEALGKLD